MDDTNQPESVEEWETEIRFILTGKRDYLLIALGSVDAYIRRLISHASNESLSLTNFNQALRLIVDEWQPERKEPAYTTCIILDLIGARQPNVGFVRIVGFMQRGFSFPKMPLSEGGYGAGWDLQMKALLNLEYYYPSAPPNAGTDAAFQSYAQVLKYQSKAANSSSYAIARLFALNLISINDPQLRQAVKTSLDAIDEIVPIILGPTHLPSANEELSGLYAQCFMIGPPAKERFVKVLERSGVGVDDDGVTLRLQIQGIYERVLIDIPDSFVREVLETNYEVGNEAIAAMTSHKEPNELLPL